MFGQKWEALPLKIPVWNPCSPENQHIPWKWMVGRWLEDEVSFEHNLSLFETWGCIYIIYDTLFAIGQFLTLTGFAQILVTSPPSKSQGHKFWEPLYLGWKWSWTTGWWVQNFTKYAVDCWEEVLGTSHFEKGMRNYSSAQTTCRCFCLK